MNWSRYIRQGHRWLSMAFTLTVLANFAARALQTGEPAPWLTYAPLPPLFLLLGSGLYLFVLPYLGGQARGQNAAGKDSRALNAP